MVEEESFLRVVIYPAVVTFVFVVIYGLILYRIRRVEKKNLKSMKRRDIQDAVETEFPEFDQEKEIKEIGIEAIETRFAFIKKALPFAMAFFWALFIFIPNLGKLPSVYITTIAAVISVITGVALRPFLENLFAGVVISFFRSTRIGDTVIIDGHYGVVEDIGLTYSILKRWDWYRIVIPNSKLIQKEVESLTVNDNYIWAYVKFYIAPDSPIEKVEQIAKEVAQGTSVYFQEEDPSFWVMGMEKDSIECWIAAWADSPAAAWDMRHEMRLGLIKRFQAEGIKFHHIYLPENAKPKAV